MDARTESPATLPPSASPTALPDIDRVAASGSCARCGRALDLASVKIGDLWYGSPLCVTDAPCPLDRRPPAVPESQLYSRPRRHLRRRRPKELNGSAAR